MGTTEKGLGQEASGEVSENGDEERIVKAEAASAVCPNWLPAVCPTLLVTPSL